MLRSTSSRTAATPERAAAGNQLTEQSEPLLKQARPRRLGEILRKRGLITSEQLEAALKHQRDTAPTKLLGQILVDLNFIRPEQVAHALAESVKIPFACLTPEMVHEDALALLSYEFLEKHNALPLTISTDTITIAIEQFTNVFLIEGIGRRLGLKVQPIAAEADNIRATRNTVLGTVDRPTAGAGNQGGDGLREILGEIGVDDLKVVEREQKDDEADLVANATDSPVIKLVNYIIKNGVECGASDIHIEPDDATFRVRYRVDGELLETIRPSSHLLPAVVSRIKIMAGMDISERRLPQDGSVTVTLAERPIDLRVSSMATRFGEKVVMRIVDREAAVRNLDSLGFEPNMLARFRAVVRESCGMVLVTGPTGSGKTTTMYGALAEIVSQDHNISTIEDPVERRLTGTNQFQVHPPAGFTFAGALRSLLRQDPDVIMVGEIRDVETAKLATEAALTGHMVLSTLHTNDAVTAVPRLVNMGVEPYLVAAALRAVLAQRLVRRICTQCRRAMQLARNQREMLVHMCSGDCALTAAFAGAGCPRCRNSGFSGRVGVFELLLLDEEILSTIARDASLQSLHDVTRQQHFTTLLQDGVEKLRQGLIHVDGLLDIVSRVDESSKMEAVPAQQAA